MTATCPCCGAPVERTDLIVDLETNIATRLGVSVKLEPAEAVVLMILNRAAPRTLRMGEAVTALHGPAEPMWAESGVKCRMSRLRRKCAPLGVTITTVPKVGWRLVLAASAVAPLTYRSRAA